MNYFEFTNTSLTTVILGARPAAGFEVPYSKFQSSEGLTSRLFQTAHFVNVEIEFPLPFQSHTSEQPTIWTLDL